MAKQPEGNGAYIEPYAGSKCPKEMENVIAEIRQGLKPELSFDGTSGTYQMRNNQRKTVAIFKPIDEEAYAPNNPRGYVGEFG